jgi:hypothetical protein
VLAVTLGFVPWLAPAQTFEQQGYVETMFTVYPQTAPNDSGQFISSSEADWEPSLRWGDWRFNGALVGDFDSHRMAERALAVSYWDRGIQRPDLDIRLLNVTWAHGPVTVELGKQFVRWGETDIISPTDRFAAEDFLTVVDPEFLGITAARVTIANQSDSLDLVYTPRFTPSRIPLLNQRWAVVPQEAGNISLIDGGAQYPGGGQYGARWKHIARYLEYSLSFFRGYNHLPLLESVGIPTPTRIELRREFPQLQTIGGDAAIPLPWLTLKAESAWFKSDTPQADDYILYVAQAERQWREWMFVAGYTGETVTIQRAPFTFDPEQGLAKSLFVRASWTIDPRRSLTTEMVARQNGAGFYGKFEYSQTFGQHWRVTGQLGVIRGSEDDFLGEYHRNSFGNLILRYSF